MNETLETVAIIIAYMATVNISIYAGLKYYDKRKKDEQKK